MAPNILFQEGKIGRLILPNRIVRAATAETMATERGEVTDQLVSLYESLAKGRSALMLLGHAYVHPRGQCSYRQIGIYEDSFIPGLKRLVNAVHRHKGFIFAQLSHAGAQSRVDTIPLVPSPASDSITGPPLAEATESEIYEVIESFGAASNRAKEAGFDGIHIQAGNGYLISGFLSPLTNRRSDGWGGDPEGRRRLAISVYRAIRKAVGDQVPVTMKLGVADAFDGGLREEESVTLAAQLEKLGLDGIEASCGNAPTSNSFAVRPYVCVDRRRALADHLYHRLFSKPVPEAYFLEYARALKKRLKIPVILVGGLRTVERMAKVVAEGDADFVAMSRPFIREPDLVSLIERGHTRIAKCTSCNLCLLHSGKDPLRCWRESWGLLFNHAWKYYVRDRLVGREKVPTGRPSS